MDPFKSLRDISKYPWVQRYYSYLSHIGNMYTIVSLLLIIVGVLAGWFNTTLFWSFSFEQILIGILFLGLVINSVITYVYKRQLTGAAEKLNALKVDSYKEINRYEGYYKNCQSELESKKDNLYKIERELNKAKEEVDQLKQKAGALQKKLDNSINEDEENELRRLIGPLHAAFDRDDEIIEFMSLPEAHISLQYHLKQKEREELAKLRAEIRDIMNECFDLARDPLDKEIDTYLNLNLFPENKQKAKETLKNIKTLVEKRHHELGAKRNSCNK